MVSDVSQSLAPRNSPAWEGRRYGGGERGIERERRQIREAWKHETGQGGTGEAKGAELRRGRAVIPRGAREGRHGEQSAQLRASLPATFFPLPLWVSFSFFCSSWLLPSSRAVYLSSPFSDSLHLSSSIPLLSLTPPCDSLSPSVSGSLSVPLPVLMFCACVSLAHVCVLSRPLSLLLPLLGERIIEQATLPFLFSWTKAGTPAVQPQEATFNVTIKERRVWVCAGASWLRAGEAGPGWPWPLQSSDPWCSRWAFWGAGWLCPEAG